MKQTKWAMLLTTALCLASLNTISRAQTQTYTDPHAKKPGLLSRLLHRNPPQPRTGTMTGTTSHGSFGRPMAGMGMGRIIGNKNSKVYHLPGDTGSMPAAKNTVYFNSEAAARAAGYHLAGGGHGSSHMQPGRGNGHMMHGGMAH